MDNQDAPAEELLDFSQELVEKIAEALKIIPMELLESIMETKPICGIKVLRCDKAVYASWRVFQYIKDCLKNVDWSKIMGRVRDQKRCDKNYEICWTCVVVDLVGAMLFHREINTEHIEYSMQDLLDFAAPWKGALNPKKDHFCYTLSIRRGLQYVIDHGLQKDVDRPYVGCREMSKIPPRNPSELGHIDSVEKLSLREALVKLESQPIGASLYVFMPDYAVAREGIYRGPMFDTSSFRGMHAVSVVGVGEENGEYFFKVKSTHGTMVGKDGYLKVSMEAMLVQIPTEDTVSDGKFAKPKPLITDFCCPTVRPPKRHKCGDGTQFS